MWNSLARAETVYPKNVPVCTMLHPRTSQSWKFHENPFMRFSVMLLTEKQTDRPTTGNNIVDIIQDIHSIFTDNNVSLVLVWFHAFLCISERGFLGPVSVRPMTSQFKDIVTRSQNHKTGKCIFCGEWVQNFVWNFKGALWNFTQNFEPYIL